MSLHENLLIGRTATGYLIAVHGSGMLQQSISFRDLAEQCLREASVDVTIDLSSCTYLDSSFLGCLVKFALHHGKSDAPRFRLLADNSTRELLFHSTNLDGLFRFVEDRPEVVGEMQPIACCAADRQSLGRHVVETHQHLADLGGPRAAIYHAVAKDVERELGAGNSEDDG